MNSRPKVQTAEEHEVRKLRVVKNITYTVLVFSAKVAFFSLLLKAWNIDQGRHYQWLQLLIFECNPKNKQAIV